MKYYVQVIETEKKTVVKEIGPYMTERMAEKAENGVNRNLDHVNFHTEIKAKEES